MNSAITTLHDVALFSDRLTIGDIQIDLDGALTVGGTELLDFERFWLTINAIEIGGAFSLSNLGSVAEPRIVTVDEPGDLITGSLANIQFSANHASLLPSAEVNASVSGLRGTIDIANGQMNLHVDRARGQISDVFEFDTDAVTLQLGPDTLPTDPVLQVMGQTSLTFVLLDDKPVRIYTDDFEISGGGQVTVTAAGLTAEQGLTHSLGLAEGVLPLDLTAIAIAAQPSERLVLNDPNLDANITVAGTVNLGLFDPLPFEPVIYFEDPAGQSQSSASGNEFELTFNVRADASESPTIRLVDLPQITLGIKDLQFGPLVVHGGDLGLENYFDTAATITLGGYNHGEWTGAIGLSAGLSWLSTESETVRDYAPLDVGAGFVVDPTTSRIQRLSSTRTRLLLDSSAAASLGLGNLPLDPDAEPEGGWGFRFQNLQLDFNVAFDIVTDATGTRIERAANQPYLDFDGLSVSSVDLDFGGLVQMNATSASINFDAFSRTPSGQVISNGPFLTFGGTRPTGHVITEQDEQNVDGSIEVTVGYEGIGLGGKAGNFGIGWNPSAVNLDVSDPNFSLGVDFYQLPGFFVALTQPEDGEQGTGNFGLDWFPIEVQEIGLRFKEFQSGLDVDAEDLFNLLRRFDSCSRRRQPASAAQYPRASYCLGHGSVAECVRHFLWRCGFRRRAVRRRLDRLSRNCHGHQR
ncbi:MAG: hypothetical protein R3C53_08930 [Pirellulaceae bacterium]